MMTMEILLGTVKPNVSSLKQSTISSSHSEKSSTGNGNLLASVKTELKGCKMFKIVRVTQGGTQTIKARTLRQAIIDLLWLLVATDGIPIGQMVDTTEFTVHGEVTEAFQLHGFTLGDVWTFLGCETCYVV
jgi:hypothetical protein